MSGLLKRATKPKASVSITLSKDTVSLGKELSGTILVTSEEEFDADEIRVEVSGVAPKAIPARFGDEYPTASDKTLWSVVKRMSGPLHLKPGFRQDFPFKVLIPARPCFIKYGMPSPVGGVLGRELGWLPRLLDRIPPSRGAHEDPESWLLKHPEWRSKIKWTANGVLAVKGQRDVVARTGFTVHLPPLTLGEKRSIQKKTRFKAVAVIFGLPLFLVGLYLREIWAFENMLIWGSMIVIGLFSFVWGFPGLVSGIRALRTKEEA